MGDLRLNRAGQGAAPTPDLSYHGRRDRRAAAAPRRLYRVLERDPAHRRTQAGRHVRRGAGMSVAVPFSGPGTGPDALGESLLDDYVSGLRSWASFRWSVGNGFSGRSPATWRLSPRTTATKARPPMRRRAGAARGGVSRNLVPEGGARPDRAALRTGELHRVRRVRGGAGALPSRAPGAGLRAKRRLLSIPFPFRPDPAGLARAASLPRESPWFAFLVGYPVLAPILAGWWTGRQVPVRAGLAVYHALVHLILCSFAVGSACCR